MCLFAFLVFGNERVILGEALAVVFDTAVISRLHLTIILDYLSQPCPVVYVVGYENVMV